MQSILQKVLIFFLVFFWGTGWTYFSVYAQSEEEESQSPVHELPRADQCSVLTMHIRELSFTLNETVKEISLLEPPVDATSSNREQYDKQLADYEQGMKLFQEKASSLRKQLDVKEQQLESCLRSGNKIHTK